MKKRLQKMLFYSLLLCSFGIGYFIFYQGTGFAVPCLFHAVTGLYCPGCGMTRCISHLLLLEFREAFYYNAAFCILSPFFLYFLIYSLSSYLRRGKVILHRVQNFLLYGCLIVLVLFGIFRNLPFFPILQPGYGLSVDGRTLLNTQKDCLLRLILPILFP